MTTIHTKKFRVEESETASADSFRTARRILFNPDILKNAKIATGDVVVILNSASSEQIQDFAIGIAWPSLRIPHDCIQADISILSTARLAVGQYARIYPLTGPAMPKLPPGIPSFSSSKQASVVRLKEIINVESKTASWISSATNSIENGKKHKDWLNLLLREVLVDLKYITASQIVCVSYEGAHRRFSISSLLPMGRNQAGNDQDQRVTPPADDRLAQEMDELAIDGSSPQPRRRGRPDIWLVDWDTAVSIVPPKSKSIRTSAAQAHHQGHRPDVESLPHRSESDAYASVGGLHKQIQEIRNLIELPLTRPDLFQHFGLKPPRGILLHGPPGTGKTHLARAIAASTRSSVLVINGPELSSAYHGETESKLRAVFREARRRSPCIVILDEVDALAPRRDEGGVGLGAGGDGGGSAGGGGEVERRVVATLLTILDGMDSGDGLNDGDRLEDEDTSPESEEDEGQPRRRNDRKGRVVVIGTTNRPNAIDPALRRPGRFDKEIEIGVPDADERLDILNVLLSKTPHNISQDELRAFSSRAHGYVGADLSALVREAGTIAIKRWLASESHSSTFDSRSSDVTLTLTLADLSASLPSVRPSALRSLFAELPPIRYADIGGQAHVIKKLRETVEWPLLHPEAFKRLGVKPPKGVLLYGPPGCSKTILARACACESGLNFLAVKGPELLNKFVGESERAVREIFRKAKASSPSIIFFDEIDSLASSRTADGDNSAHEGVITSLLNEMDGVQELQGVTIIAATNRPEIIDSALMRPGRFDRALYVGPPDQAGREEILRIRMINMAVDPNIDIAEIARLSEGCSGAEMTALCQEAAILTMQRDMNAPFVPQETFTVVAGTMKRQITSTVIQKFERWKEVALFNTDSRC
ncbi:AAA family ATPase [Amanita rubescens]|nr:AAA family ATPase [Amanita rubescens]